MTEKTPDYVATAKDQADRLRSELVASTTRGYQQVTGALHSTAKAAYPDLKGVVDTMFDAAEKGVARGRSLANRVVESTRRFGA